MLTRGETLRYQDDLLKAGSCKSHEGKHQQARHRLPTHYRVERLVLVHDKIVLRIGEELKIGNAIILLATETSAKTVALDISLDDCTSFHPSGVALDSNLEHMRMMATSYTRPSSFHALVKVILRQLKRRTTLVDVKEFPHL